MQPLSNALYKGRRGTQSTQCSWNGNLGAAAQRRLSCANFRLRKPRSDANANTIIITHKHAQRSDTFKLCTRFSWNAPERKINRNLALCLLAGASITISWLRVGCGFYKIEGKIIIRRMYIVYVERYSQLLRDSGGSRINRKE